MQNGESISRLAVIMIFCHGAQRWYTMMLYFDDRSLWPVMTASRDAIWWRYVVSWDWMMVHHHDTSQCNIIMIQRHDISQRYVKTISRNTSRRPTTRICHNADHHDVIQRYLVIAGHDDMWSWLIKTMNQDNLPSQDATLIAEKTLCASSLLRCLTENLRHLGTTCRP